MKIREGEGQMGTFEPFKDTQEENDSTRDADVFIPHSWKQFVFHQGCSFNLTSILNAGLIAGGRQGRETRHTLCFTPLDSNGVLKKKNSVSQETFIYKRK